MCVSEGGPKEAKHEESWFLPAVEDEVARIDRNGKGVVDKCLDVDIFLAKCANPKLDTRISVCSFVRHAQGTPPEI